MSEYFIITEDTSGQLFVIPNSQKGLWFSWRDSGFPEELPYWAREIGETEEVLFVAPKFLDNGDF